MTGKTAGDRLALMLLILRLTLGVFLLQWGIEKFVVPETTAAIFKHFYMVDGLSHQVAYVLGGLQCLVAMALMLGLFQRISYGIAFLIHSVSTISTIPAMLDPWGQGNHLFLTGVPVLAAFALLYVMRDMDTKSLDHRRR